MFEDSTFESMGRIRTRSRGWMFVTLALNSTILLALVLIPLLYPEALPRMAESILIQAPPPPVSIEPLQAHPTSARAAVVHVSLAQDLQAPSVIPKIIRYPDKPEVAAVVNLAEGSGMPENGTAAIGSPFNQESSIHVVQQKPQPPRPISSGVMDGMIVFKVTPAYPSIAKAAGISGDVVLRAIISKNGSIEGLRVVNGPALLQQAAIDAVKQWRYRPYLLNGEPIEVETTVHVVFKLN